MSDQEREKLKAERQRERRHDRDREMREARRRAQSRVTPETSRFMRDTAPTVKDPPAPDAHDLGEEP